MQKTKVQIIEETRDYYADVTKRAYNPEKRLCSYIDEHGRMCAFGRCEITPSSAPGDLYDRFMMFKDDTIDREIDAVLKEEYRGHGLAFWADIQYLHDTPNHFGETTWSPVGLAEINRLIKKYGNTETSNAECAGSVS